MSVRIAHVSDVHFGGENRGATEAAVQAIAAFAPVLTVVSGDLTLNGEHREFDAARAWLASLAKIAPLLETPGNHDTPYWNPIMRVGMPFRRYRRYIGWSDRDGHDGETVSARSLNTARGVQFRPDWSKGVIDLSHVARTAAELKGGFQGLKLFSCHHPLIEPATVKVPGAVQNGRAAAVMLARAGVDLILTGHTHMPFTMALEAGGYTAYAVGAGTLSLRTRGFPASFTTIEASEEAFLVSALGWTGTEFESLEQWTLPRLPDPVKA